VNRALSPERMGAYAILLVATAITVVPIFGVFLVSLNPPGAAVSGYGLPSDPTLDTYRYAWDTANFSAYMRASLLFSVTISLVTSAVSILSGYALGSLRVPGAPIVFPILLFGLFVPFEAVIVPLYYDLRQFGLTDTPWAVLLPQIAVNIAFGTFWMRAYFRGLPRSLSESAALDGAGTWQTLWRVLVPPGRAPVFTMVLLFFIWSWNEFLIPLVMVQSENLRTAPLGLAFFAGRYTTDRVGQAVAAVIIALPIIVLFLALQRQFIRGVLAGAANE